MIGNLVGGGAEAMIKKGYDYLGQKIDNNIGYLIKTFKFYTKNCSVKTKLYQRTYDTLQNLKENNILIGLCTNKKQFLAEKILKKFKKFFLFLIFILGSNGNIPLKPEISMPKKCMKHLNTKNYETIFVGDSENDISPSKKLGMLSVFVTYGYGRL